MPVTLVAGPDDGLRAALADAWRHAHDAGRVLHVGADDVSGCACCAGALALRTRLVQRWRDAAPAHVVIELAAVAQPAAVVDALRAPPFDEAMQVRDVVLALDARHVGPYLGSPAHPLAAVQLECATAVVLRADDTRSFADDASPFADVARSLADVATALAQAPPVRRPVIAWDAQAPLDPERLHDAAPALTLRARPAGGTGAEPARSAPVQRARWQWPPEIRFDRRRLHAAWEAAARAGALREWAGVFATGRAVYAAAGHGGWTPTAWRGPSVCEAAADDPAALARLARDLDAAIAADRR